MKKRSSTDLQGYLQSIGKSLLAMIEREANGGAPIFLNFVRTQNGDSFFSLNRPGNPGGYLV
jgi:hypothetical protein